MPTAKRKASASPAPSNASDGGAALEIEEPLTDLQPPPHKRPALATTTDSALCNLPLDTLEALLPIQKKRCLQTLVGGLPPIPQPSSSSSQSQPAVASTSALVPSTAEDEDAPVFTDTPSTKANDDLKVAASACVGLEEEFYQLHTMLHATITKSESNSALLIGASGSGKSLLVDSVLRSISNSLPAPSKAGLDRKGYYHVHLAGSVQINDRSAMKEMAQQLILQRAFTEDDVTEAMEKQPLEDEEALSGTRNGVNATDQVFGGDNSESEDDLPQPPTNEEEAEIQDELAGAILSSLNNIIAHIIALLSTDNNAARKPLVITLDDFEQFTARPRQAMLYCLLDAVQAASYGAGLAVVGLTGRVDSVDLLEKRVKSRFSHRILHVRPPGSYETFERVVRNALAPLSFHLDLQKELVSLSNEQQAAFITAWESDVTALFANPHFREVLQGIHELSNDVRMAYRILLPTLTRLSVLEPTFDLPHLLSTAATEVGEGMFHVLRDLTEPEIALLIAVKHLQTRDRQVFNFEMCFDELRRFASRDSRERQAVSTGSALISTNNNNNNVVVNSSNVGEGGVLSGSAVATPFYADRKIALLSFHTLLSLEILLPENYVSTLNIANPVAKPSAAPFASTGRSNQNTIRKEFWKVRCILPPSVIVQAVKDKGRVVGVSSSLVKWASSHG